MVKGKEEIAHRRERPKGVSLVLVWLSVSICLTERNWPLGMFVDIGQNFNPQLLFELHQGFYHFTSWQLCLCLEASCFPSISFPSGKSILVLEQCSHLIIWAAKSHPAGPHGLCFLSRCLPTCSVSLCFPQLSVHSWDQLVQHDRPRGFITTHCSCFPSGPPLPIEKKTQSIPAIRWVLFLLFHTVHSWQIGVPEATGGVGSASGGSAAAHRHFYYCTTATPTPPLHPLNFLQALQSGREVGVCRSRWVRLRKGGKDTEQSRCPARSWYWGRLQAGSEESHQHRAQLSPWESSSLHSTAPPPELGSDIERMRTAAPYFAPVEKPMFCPQAGEEGGGIAGCSKLSQDTS